MPIRDWTRYINSVIPFTVLSKIRTRTGVAFWNTLESIIIFFVVIMCNMRTFKSQFTNKTNLLTSYCTILPSSFSIVQNRSVSIQYPNPFWCTYIPTEFWTFQWYHQQPHKPPPLFLTIWVYESPHVKSKFWAFLWNFSWNFVSHEIFLSCRTEVSEQKQSTINIQCTTVPTLIVLQLLYIWKVEYSTVTSANGCHSVVIISRILPLEPEDGNYLISLLYTTLVTFCLNKAWFIVTLIQSTVTTMWFIPGQAVGTLSVLSLRLM